MLRTASVFALIISASAFADEPVPHDKQYFLGSWLNSYRTIQCTQFPKHIEITTSEGNGVDILFSSYADTFVMEKASDQPILVNTDSNTLSVANARLEILKRGMMLASMGATQCEFDMIDSR